MAPDEPVFLSFEEYEKELDAAQREALLAAVARGEADATAGRTVPHERVRAWLLHLAAGGTSPAPQSTDPD